MADVFTREERSRVMSLIRGRGNKSTEKAFVSMMKGASITGWRRHVSLKIEPQYNERSGNNDLRKPSVSTTVRPDFIFRNLKVAVFLDGCFWHRCPIHFRSPSNNAEFWKKKIDANVMRDRRVDLALRAKGWRVLRFWEHELLAPMRVVRKLNCLLAISLPVGDCRAGRKE